MSWLIKSILTITTMMLAFAVIDIMKIDPCHMVIGFMIAWKVDEIFEENKK